ncbi:MAG: hypothetical protein QW478_11410 [Candidatus Micrarchaeaceae archaeon]
MANKSIAIVLIAIGGILGVLALMQLGLDIPDDIMTLIFLALGAYLI